MDQGDERRQPEIPVAKAQRNIDKNPQHRPRDRQPRLLPKNRSDRGADALQPHQARLRVGKRPAHALLRFGQCGLNLLLGRAARADQPVGRLTELLDDRVAQPDVG